MLALSPEPSPEAGSTLDLVPNSAQASPHVSVPDRTVPGEGAAAGHAVAEPPSRAQGRKEKSAKARVRTYSATDRDMDMLTAISDYHGFSRSAMLASLIRKEFWRCFPSGTAELRPDEGARIETGPAGGFSGRS